MRGGDGDPAGLAPATTTITYDPAPVRRKRRPRPGKLTPSELARAKQEWQDDKRTIGQIAQRLGVNDSAIHWHAKRHGWGKRPATAPRFRRGAKPGPKPRGPAEDHSASQADPTPASGRGGSPAPVRITKDWEMGKKLWLENKDIATIAAAVGVTTSAVYLHSKEWPPRAKGQPAPMRRCDSCQLPTGRDPCHHCGKPRPKYWKDD